MYDYIVLGAGIGGLSIAALLAQDEYKVKVLEQSSVPGGYAHSFSISDYTFCHQIQYVMGDEKNGPVKQFVDKIGIDAPFQSLRKDGFDLVMTPSHSFNISHGLERFCAHMQEFFPEERGELVKYFSTLERIFLQAKGNEKVITPREIITNPFQHKELLRNVSKTTEQVFREHNFSENVRNILAGQSGNLGVPPNKASFLMHAAMQTGYCAGAFYPSNGVHHFINVIVSTIEESGEVVYDCTVNQLSRKGNTILAVHTNKGSFTAKHYISNLDPQLTAQMIRPTPWFFKRQTTYQYSPGVFIMYLGLADRDVTKEVIGRRNIWHHSEPVNNSFYKQLMEHNYERPWAFISAPSN